MKQRILVAVVGVPALLAVLCAAPDWATLALLMGLCIIASHELLAAVLPPEKTRRWWGLAATLAVFVVANVYFSHERFAGTAAAELMPWLVAALVVVVFLCMVLEYGKKEEMDFTALCAILVAGAAIPLALSCLLRLRMLEHGAGLVLIPLVAAFMSDTMALFGGMLFGKTKLAPVVSPKKDPRGRGQRPCGRHGGHGAVPHHLLPVYGGAAAHRLVRAAGSGGRGAGAAGRSQLLLRQAAVRHQGLRTAAAGARRRTGPV